MKFLIARPFLKRAQPWIVTIVAVLAIGYFKLYFNHILKIDSPILLFFGAIAISAWYGGFRQGLFANLISIAFILHYFVPFRPETPVYVWTVRLAFYTMDCFIISWICSKMRASERAARSNETRLRKVFESDMIGLLFSDFNGRLIEANDYFLRLIGATREELKSGQLTWAQFTPPEYLAEGMKALHELKTKGFSAPFEKQYLRRDGTRIFISVGASRLDDQTIFAYVSDIHDRKLTEKALAESKEQLEKNVAIRTVQLTAANEELSRLAEQFKESQSFLDSVVEHIPNMVFVKEAMNLTFVRFNKAGEKLVGKTREEFIGKSDYDLFPKEQADFFVEKDRGVLASNAIVDIPEEFLNTSTGIRILHTKKIPLFDIDGRPQYLLGISEDITEKKAAEKQRMDLVQSEAARLQAEKSAAQLEFLSEASASLNKSLDIQHMLSDFCQVVTNYMASFCLVDLFDDDGKIVERLITDDHSYKKSEFLKSFEKVNVNFDAEFGIGAVLKHSHSQVFSSLTKEFLIQNISLSTTQAQEIMDSGVRSLLMVPLVYYGRVLGALTMLSKKDKIRFDEVDVSIAHDLSKRASIAIENSKLFSKANEASRAKSAFLANISHEIRTPLGAIIGFAELCQTAGKLEQTESQYISKIVENGHQLLRLVDEVLDISKAESDRIEIEHIPFNLAHLLNDVISTLNLKASGKGLKLTLKTDQRVPERIVSDPLRIKQILLNIVGNAIKFTVSGEVQVSTGYDSKSKTLEFLVADTGIGLSSEQSLRLFAPFVQADESMTRKFGGTGLGLFLSRKLSRLLGGDLVLLKSTLGEGSQFKISIKVEDAIGMEPKKSLNPSQSFQNVDTSNLKGKILVVEDSLDNQILFKAFLSKMNMDVEIAENGRVGVKKALDHSYDIVLMDIQMPEMDGFEAIRALREQGYNGKVVALTAHAMKGARELCLQKGFDDYLCKPISRNALSTCISNFLTV